MKIRDMLVTDKFISHEIGEDVITLNGIERVQSTLRNTRDPETREFLPKLPEDWDWSWVVGSGKYRGKLANRIESYYFKELGINLPKNIKTQIGAILSDNRLPKGTFHFDFTDKFDWSAGEFGDGGSCFWASRKRDKWALEAYGAMAIRFYTDETFEEGVGRAWLIPDDPLIGDTSLLVFNGYGMDLFGHPLQDISQILANFLGLRMRNVDVSNRGESDSSIYFNGGGNAILLATPEVVSRYGYEIGKVPGIDFRIPTDIIARCKHTGVYIYSNDFHKQYNGEYYCEDAYNELFGQCEVSHRECLLTDLRQLPDGRLVHIDEYNRLLTPCQCCNERSMADELVWIESSSIRVCQACYDTNVVTDVVSGELCLIDTTAVVDELGNRISLSTGYKLSLELDTLLSEYLTNVQDIAWLQQAHVAHNLEELQTTPINIVKEALCSALLAEQLTYVDLSKNIKPEVAYGMVGYLNITARTEGLL